MRPSLPLIVAALLTAGVVSGCGLKDDLYLPPEAAEPQEQDDTAPDSEPEDAENSRA
ncbi:LPS translocon maturation chaperone LptM [Wenzhouxiangella limi]|uniref:Lipoprotein n=1 Tax=Wenzhouxiangella limi TaxID=2707351 RepID=A0A845UW24_9GAMM|nr:lipoprotein [Wenzhouxiangella limi]NDY94452.1 lipoprotein [Wenzhouxiangella limi]